MAIAQDTLNGLVTDNLNRPLAGATVRTADGRQVTQTNEQGRFSLTGLKTGRHTLIVSFIGYTAQRRQITTGEATGLIFRLDPASFIAEDVVVRATRAGDKSAATYKNIDRQEIEQNNFGQDLPFILNNTPGVVTTSDAGAGIGYTGIRIRGSDATRINITVNGIPYNDSESQGTFWVNMPDFASSVENIQIQRGVGTSTNGAGAFGGSLNIQTSGSQDRPYAEVNNTFGSFNTWKNTLKLGTGWIDGKYSFDGRLSRIKSDGYIDRGSSNLKSYFLSGAYRGKKDLLRLNVFSGTERTYQAWNGVPESRYLDDLPGMQAYIDRNGLNETDAQNLLQSGRSYNSFTYRDQTDNYWQDHYQLLYARQFSDKLSFNGALHYTRGKGYFEELKPGEDLEDYGLEPVIIGTDTIGSTDLVRRRWLDNHFYGLTYAFDYRPSAVLSFTLGGAYNEYRGDHFGQVIWAQYASNGSNDRRYYQNDAFKTDFNTYLKIGLQATKSLSFFADLQYRRIFYQVTGTEKNLNVLNVRDVPNFFNPKLGASYTISPAQNLYASYSIANKEPNRDDYINLPENVLPVPENLQNVEVGYRLNTGALHAGLNVYGMFYKDQLVTTGKINDVGEYFRQNVDRSYRMGIEADASYVISPKFALNANAAFSRNKIRNFTEFIDDYDNGGQQAYSFTNTDISFSPRQVLFAELVYKPFSGFAAAYQSKYVGKQYLDNTQTESRKLDAYHVGNIRLGYDFSFSSVRNVNLGLLVSNIFNKMYASNGYTYGYKSGTVVRENFYFPQAGTNFLLSLNVRF
ncbi:TonB-dependent receptor [Pedobacter yulinensis]|uniref:TonB-dependent receptor n=2 Tax=Pedobacter yulinensis TaxID=2126353 RepID=A0A2T3HS12_9SPHI|nr:TonB-dependent receptor [Pedobacter yulinensis]